MKDELEQQLFKDYPHTFRNHSYLAVGDGWYDLVKQIAEKVEPFAEGWWRSKNPEPPVPEGEEYVLLPKFTVQVKEKFGGLRFYTVHGLPDEVIDFMLEKEAESFKTCEVCGKPGERRGNGWVKALCDEHAKE